MDSHRHDDLPAWRSPLEAYPELLPDASSRRSRVGGLVVLGAAAVLAVMLGTVPALGSWRIVAYSALGLLTASALLLQLTRGTLWATRLMVAGSWLLVTAAVCAGPGLGTLHLAAYPLLLFLAGWLLGGGYSAALYAMSCLAVLFMVWGQSRGLLGAGDVPLQQLSTQAVTLLVVMAATQLLTQGLVRVFLRSYAGLRRQHSQNLLTLQATQTREADLRALTEHIPGLLFECDAQGRCVFVNQRLARFFGKPAQVLIGTPMNELLGSGSVRDYSAYQSVVLRGEVAEFDMRRLAPDGVWCNVEVTLVPRQALDSPRVIGWYGMVYDVTRREQVALELRDKATHDALTGLPNRLLFHERLEHALQSAFRRKKQVAVMFIDLDNFKRINDVMGHAAGDLFLREVARRITGAIRGIDTVARLGGDEFVVLAEEVESPETAALIADKVLEALTQPVNLGQETVSSGGSIGIALGPQDGNTGEALLRAADAALYEAKSAGRKCYRLFGASGFGNSGFAPAPETGGFSRPAQL